MKEIKSTLYISEHKSNLELIGPILRFLSGHPAYLVARKGIVLFPFIKSIPIDVSKFKSVQNWRTDVEKFLVAAFRPRHRIVPEFTGQASKLMMEGNDILMFPSGKVPHNGEEPWKPGVGRLLKELVEKNEMDPWISFFYINGLGYHTDEPQRASSVISVQDDAATIALKLQEQYMQKKQEYLQNLTLIPSRYRR